MVPTTPPIQGQRPASKGSTVFQRDGSQVVFVSYMVAWAVVCRTRPRISLARPLAGRVTQVITFGGVLACSYCEAGLAPIASIFTMAL